MAVAAEHTAPLAAPGARVVEQPRAETPSVEIRDQTARIVFVPILGLGISHLAGLYGHHTPASPWFWAGAAWFILLSYLIWEGVRTLWMSQLPRLDWFRHPWLKVVFLFAVNAFYTAPLSVAMLWGWYKVAGMAPDWGAIRLATIVTLVVTLVIMHIYETVLLIHERWRDVLAYERLERSKAQAELQALRAQIDPHFLFNTLNALTDLIESDPSRALAFSETLAQVYRYILASKDSDLVPLVDELRFVQTYFALVRIRFEDAVKLQLPPDDRLHRFKVPPISVQLLVENAIKHNDFDRSNPLEVRIGIESGFVVVGNAKRTPRQRKTTGGAGLKNLDERCRVLMNRGVEIRDGESAFEVRLPLK